jgi:L-malate glycosyltransferase
MRLLVLDENYPHLDNLMGDVFVHVRLKEYSKSHVVKAVSFFHKPGKLIYEDIQLQLCDNIASVVDAVGEFKPDRILIHFYQSWMLESVIRKFDVPVIIWVHGYEALGWYRRLFNYSLYSPVFLRYIKKNTLQQIQFRRLINYSNKTPQVSFVFVSDWMRRVTETDTLSFISKKHIIPNPIDTNLFLYKKKNAELRKKILLLRSFSTRKYANDISVEAVLKLSKRSVFKDVEFTFIGEGALYDKLTASLKGFSNVNFEKRAIRQVAIPNLHLQHGIFLCPTRQDAQGVSMCEAMSSGLIPVTSNNTAIPEFVANEQSGFITNNSTEIANAIEKLYSQPEMFETISENAADSIRKKCSLQSVISRELKLIETAYDKDLFN